MLRFIIALHILCFVPGNAFPQRNKPDSESNFDFDAYLEHFTPLKREVNDHPRFLPNQDYRYIPLLGERPDYIPPILHRGHFPHPNIPRRVVKHRAWHSNYQNSNFPTSVIEQEKKNIKHQDAMQSHKRELHQPTDFALSNSNFHLHSKIEDFGDYEAPVVIEAIEEEEIPLFRQQNDDYDIPVVVSTIVRKKTPDSIKNNHHKKPIAVPPREIQVVKGADPKNPAIIEPSLDLDYEAPLIVEAVKKNPISKMPNRKQTMVVKTPEINKSSFPEDYEEPIVVETLTKVDSSVHNKRHGHRKPNKLRPVVNKHDHTNPVGKPVDKPVSSSYLDYEAPIVVEAFPKKESVYTKGHDNKLVKENPLDKHDLENPILRPVKIVPSYSEDYESPIVLEAFPKKESTVQAKEHGHTKPVEVKPIIKHDQKNPVELKPIIKHDQKNPVELKPIIKHDQKNPVELKPIIKHDQKNPVELKPIIKHDQKNPVELKPIIKHDQKNPVEVKPIIKHDKKNPVEVKPIKGHSHKNPVEARPVINHEKDIITNPAEKPVVSSYTEDYVAPVVVDALTIEEVFHKGHSNKKSSVMQTEKLEASKNGHKQIVGSTEEYITEEYGTEEYIAEEYGTEEYITEESEYSIHGQEDYDSPVVVGSKMSHDYNYEDSIVIEDKTPKKEHNSKGHSHKSVVQPPVKIRPEVTSENYEKISSNPTENQQGYATSKEITKSPVIKEEKKRIVKREVKVDYEDYDLPNVVGAVFKESTIPEEHGIKTSIEVKSSEYEQNYVAPVIVEAIVKRDNPVTKKHTHTKPAKIDKPEAKHPIDYYDYEEPVVLEAIVKKSPGVAASHKQPSFVKPIDYAYDYELPVIVETFTKGTATSEPKLETVELPPKINTQINQEDYEMPIVVEAFTKMSTTSHAQKPVVKSEHKKQSEIPVVNIQIEEKPVDAYTRNKRERELHKELPKPVNPIVRPGDYFDEWESIPKGNPVHGHFESKGMLDNSIVLDSITINRENPDGREIPFLEVLAVEDQADSRRETGLKVMAFNKENGDVDVINLGHVDSNHGIDELDDHGSGSVLDERSVGPRNFLPLDSNAWSFMTHVQAQERRKFKRCVTPRNETGNCMPVQMCPVPSVGGTVDDFLKNVCIIDEVFIGICCPEFPVETVRVDWGQFGRPDTEPLIGNGEESQEAKECGKLPSTIGDKDSWPWMAPLVSTTSDKVFCGGALINENYVLAAAHCTSRIPRNQILVRLGDLDSRQSSSEFAVTEIKRHAQYNPRTLQNDIALLKLSRRVPLGNFRKLVCLPDSDVEDYVGETAVLLKWQEIAEKGAVESLPVISNHDCQNRLGTLIGGSVLCTKTRNDETMCNANSGAPLVIRRDGKFKIIGVLTWNRNDCDGRYPSIFTRISSFQKWIRTHAT